MSQKKFDFECISCGLWVDVEFRDEKRIDKFLLDRIMSIIMQEHKCELEEAGDE